MTKLSYIGAIVVLLSFRGFAWQAPAPAKPSGAPGGTVTIDVAVSDKEGRPIRGLEAQDFSLLDDKRPQPITSLRAVDLDAGTPPPQSKLF